MKGNRAVLTVVIVLAVIVTGWWLFSRGRGGVGVDLVSQVDSAQKRPDPGLFSTADVTLSGETKKAIAVAPAAGTRLIFRVKVPDDGWLRVSLGLKPEAWTQEGDGVKFMVGISDGRAFDQLFTQHVNPFGNAADRRWIPVMVDVSQYAGEDVELMLNTFASPEGRVGDLRSDLAVWGAPEIIVR